MDDSNLRLCRRCQGKTWSHAEHGLCRPSFLAVHTITRTMIEVQDKTVRAGSWMLGRKGAFGDRSGREW